VTYNAKIYAWEGTKRVLVRDGDGPYTCFASGSNSLRLGKPPLPYPDSACADQNAWAFLEAFWAEPDPMKPSKPLPRAPGIVWMLAGMNVVQGKEGTLLNYLNNFATARSGSNRVRRS
jgi:hypothetical protein